MTCFSSSYDHTMKRDREIKSTCEIKMPLSDMAVLRVVRSSDW